MYPQEQFKILAHQSMSFFFSLSWKWHRRLNQWWGKWLGGKKKEWEREEGRNKRGKEEEEKTKYHKNINNGKTEEDKQFPPQGKGTSPVHPNFICERLAIKDSFYLPTVWDFHMYSASLTHVGTSWCLWRLHYIRNYLDTSLLSFIFYCTDTFNKSLSLFLLIRLSFFRSSLSLTYHSPLFCLLSILIRQLNILYIRIS